MNGTVSCWGANEYSQSTGKFKNQFLYSPTKGAYQLKDPDGGTIIDMAAGLCWTGIVSNSGKVWAIGRETEDFAFFTLRGFSDTVPAVSVSAGVAHYCAIFTNGKIR